MSYPLLILMAIFLMKRQIYSPITATENPLPCSVLSTSLEHSSPDQTMVRCVRVTRLWRRSHQL
ncbi:hypothetical protein BKA93DRAFT_760734 [Sparassis latifolia]